MKTLLIDIGNTLMKAALADNEGITSYHNWSDVASLVAFVKKEWVEQVYVVSVTDKHKELAAALPPGVSLKVFDRQTPLPLKNHYRTKDTLGLDRLVALLGALELFPGQNNLVIDVGTCITYDLLTADCDYYGGAISPGISIRLRSMHDYTSKLPLLQIEENAAHPEVTGDSSANSMLSGVMNGILFEVV